MQSHKLPILRRSPLEGTLHASAPRQLQWKNNWAAGHLVVCDSVPQGRASRSETRTDGPVTSKPTVRHDAARWQSSGHAPHRAYVRKSSRLTKRLSSTTAITRLRRVTLFSVKTHHRNSACIALFADLLLSHLRRQVRWRQYHHGLLSRRQFAFPFQPTCCF